MKYIWLLARESLINSELLVQKQFYVKIQREQELRVLFIGDDSYIRLWHTTGVEFIFEWETARWMISRVHWWHDRWRLYSDMDNARKFHD